MSMENSFNLNTAKKEDPSNAAFVSKNTGLSPLELDEKYIIHPHHQATASNVADFVPVIGSAKMIVESLKGSQIGTDKKIEGWRRLVHGATGAAFLASDLTGVGAIGSTLGKVVTKGGIRLSEKILEKDIIKNEAKVLYARGKERRGAGDKIEQSANDDVYREENKKAA